MTKDLSVHDAEAAAAATSAELTAERSLRYGKLSDIQKLSNVVYDETLYPTYQIDDELQLQDSAAAGAPGTGVAALSTGVVE